MKQSEANFGWTGKILEVDLTRGRALSKILDRKILEDNLGGRALNINILYDRLKKNTPALEPGNYLIFSSGPMVRSGFPLANRCVVSAKSPLSYYAMGLAGGFFAAELKAAGYDGIIVTGRAPKPTQILIHNNQVRIEDASDLWGLGTHETQAKIRSQRGEKIRVACIGPAGERMARIAGIMFDQRAAGRGGLGAVMGSKNLKAIAVKGTAPVQIYNRGRMKSLIKKLAGEIRKKPGPRPTFPQYGTIENIAESSLVGVFPSKNFQKGLCEHTETIGINGMWPFVTRKPSPCFQCPVKCTNAFQVLEEPQVATHGPEYETIAAFGGVCGISDPVTIIRANYLCNNLGLDTISTGVSIGFIMECIERGLVPQSDVGVKDLAFGNNGPLLEAIQAIGLRKGDFGYILGEGTRILSEKIGQGSLRFAAHVKGLELAMYEPRGSVGMALVYGVANRGACHHSQGFPLREESVKATFHDYTGKGRLVKKLAQTRILVDSLTYCGFLTPSLHWAVPEALSALTGVDFSLEKLREISDRVNNIERLFVLREGCLLKEDTLPDRFFDEPLPDGPAKGFKLDRKAFERMLQEYYEACGWGPDGIPKKKH